MSSVDYTRLRGAYEQVRDELLAERTPDGHWVGELSSSALSTATAVSALAVVRGRGSEVGGQRDLGGLIDCGVAWLVRQQNEDGGFGDTDLSYSNIATTYLVVAALHLAGVESEHVTLIRRANSYIDAKGRLNGLRERYGIDKTFVVPIMTNLALAGLVEWREVDPLPFELACVPQSWYRFVGMPVVSYAIPALVAIGQARFFHAPPRNPVTRLLRRLSIARSLKVLRRMQPDSGGYLEATPLTSFVVMSLASKPRPVAAVYPKPRPVVAVPRNIEMLTTATTGRGFEDEIIREGVKFLVNSARPDGSWPIDTNLATWNTTLAINALAGAGEDVAALLDSRSHAPRGNALVGRSASLLDWLLSCQHTKPHPFTGADPGGYGWTNLSGAVPDADDTAGAVIALSGLRRGMPLDSPDRRKAAEVMAIAGAWLLKVRNDDGGWPTFCRGWGRLPFDRSGTDLSAHAARAFTSLADLMHEYDADFDKWFFDRYDIHMLRRFNSLAWRTRQKYLTGHQHPDGSWSPLWFGNQDHPSEENPVYGTAKVLMAYRDLGLMDSPEAQRGVAWLIANQNDDGGWGSGVWQRLQVANCKLQNEEQPAANLQFAIANLQSSVEETALAVEALLAACPRNATEGVPYSAVARGLSWLLDRVENNQHRQPAPIGFYFAKLWYYERLYPLIFTVAALGRACREFAPPAEANPAAQPSEIRAS